MITTWLIGLMIRVSLLLAVGYLVARLLERKSAAMAHRALVMTLACTSMFPLILFTAPGWQWTQPAWMAFPFFEVETTPAAWIKQMDHTNVEQSPLQIDEHALESGGFPAFDLKSLFSDGPES